AHTLAVRPPARSEHAMAYDVSRSRVVLFGGSDATLAPLSDTWEWDGSVWTQRAPATSPPPRRAPAMAYMLHPGKTPLFWGGTHGSSTGLLGDAWTWDGSTWTQVASAGPGPRAKARLAYELARQRTLLFGGAGTGLYSLADTWEWDGSTWTQLAKTQQLVG